MDIEYSEWAALKTILKENLLSKVKQLVFETHLIFYFEEKDTAEIIESYRQYIAIMKEIKRQGFTLWFHHINVHCFFQSPYTGNVHSQCNELSFRNINFEHE